MSYVIIYQYIKKYLIESILITLALCITVISFVLHQQGQTSPDVLAVQDSMDRAKERSPSEHPAVHDYRPSSISVDVSGAVQVPDVYEVSPGARLKDLIDKARGLSDEADELYVARNFNMAKLVGDQEKIYIPYNWDIANGTFVEEKRILEYLSPLYPNPSSQTQNPAVGARDTTSSTLTISINTSSVEELDTLPGIGPVTAQKIVDNRPYSSLEELLSKKVVNQNTYGKIEEFITP